MLFRSTLMLGKIEGRRRSGRQRMRWLDAITDSVDMGSAVMLRAPLDLLTHGTEVAEQLQLVPLPTCKGKQRLKVKATEQSPRRSPEAEIARASRRPGMVRGSEARMLGQHGEGI